MSSLTCLPLQSPNLHGERSDCLYVPVLCKREKYLRGSRSVGGSDWRRVEKGRGYGKERDKEGLMLLNCVQEAQLLTAPGIRAEKESRHCIRSPSINFTALITNKKGHCKSELVV